MYNKKFIKIIKKIVNENIDKRFIAEYLINAFDCEDIYDLDDEMLTDIFFTLKHYASGEEDVSQVVWIYFLRCLSEECEYSIEEKMRITTNPFM